MDDPWFNNGSDWVFIMCCDGVFGKWQDGPKMASSDKNKTSLIQLWKPLHLHPLDLFDRAIWMITKQQSLLRHLSGIAAHQNFCKKPMSQSVGCIEPRWRRCWRVTHYMSPASSSMTMWGIFLSSDVRCLAVLAKTHFHFSPCVNCEKQKNKSWTSSRHRNTSISKLEGKFLITSENMHLCSHCLSDRNERSHPVWHKLFAQLSCVPIYVL